ncbi:hypothetical protein T484DRAFT_1922526, partial [Baffinella frigidus]
RFPLRIPGGTCEIGPPCQRAPPPRTFLPYAPPYAPPCGEPSHGKRLGTPPTRIHASCFFGGGDASGLARGRARGEGGGTVVAAGAWGPEAKAGVELFFVQAQEGVGACQVDEGGGDDGQHCQRPRYAESPLGTCHRDRHLPCRATAVERVWHEIKSQGPHCAL